MKKIVYLVFVAVIGMIALESFKPLRVTRRDGTDPGYTGSPGDSGKNCTFCHGGTTLNVDGWITSNIPSTGYVPGQTYTITATNTSAGSTRFGFSVSPQALDGTQLGTMVITDTARTKLIGNGKYITYKADGVDGIDMNSWTWDWIAPALGTGEVVFYGAFNANPGHKGGDNTTLSTLKVQEHGFTGVQSLTDRIEHFSVYPNPSNDLLKVSMELKNSMDIKIDLIDLKGKRVASVANGKYTGQLNKEISTAALPEGNYFLRIQAAGKTATQQVSVQH